VRPGFRDTVRVAGTDPQMMLDILLTNRAAVLEQISAYQSRLTAVAAHIAQEDETALLHWLQTAQARASALPNGKIGRAAWAVKEKSG
jgi:prephenate dehydrogenase